MRAFYWLAAVNLLSAMGSAMTGIAPGFWLFEQTGDAAPVLLVAFFSSLPPIFAGALAGVWIDRFDKRAVLVLSDMGQSAGTLLLLLAIASGNFSPPLLYVIVLWQSFCGMVQPPTMLALTTTLVPEAGRERANALQQSLQRIAGILAPGLTGVIYSLTGLAGILPLDFLTFALAVLVTWRVVPPQTKHPPEKRPSMWRDIRMGFDFLRARGALLALILHGTLINFFLSSVLTLTTPYILRLTHDETVTGLVLSAFNAGALVGAVMIGVWGGTRPRIHTIMPAILTIGLAVVGYGLAQTPLALVLAAFGILLPMPFVTTLIPAILQSRTPEALQGRVFAVMFQLASLANPAGLLLAGFLVDRVLEPAANFSGAGMRLFIVVSGAAMFSITLGFYAQARIRAVEDAQTTVG